MVVLHMYEYSLQTRLDTKLDADPRKDEDTSPNVLFKE